MGSFQMVIMMKRSKNFLKSLLVTATFCVPFSVAAQSSGQKEALVISGFGDLGAAATRSVRQDALAVSEALFGLGYNVRRLENPNPDTIDSALGGSAGYAMVVYYASTGGIDVDLETRLGSANDAETLVFLDVCRGENIAVASETDEDILPEPAWTAPGTLTEETFIAASVPPGTACGADTVSISDRLIEGLNVPGLALDLAFAEDDPAAEPIWLRTTLNTAFVFRQPSSDTRLTAEDYALLETLSPDAQAQMIALWTQAGIAVDRDGVAVAPATPQAVVQDTIVISAPVQPIRPAQAVISPVISSGAAQVQDGISVIAADPTRSVENRAVPGVGGLPTPSIIVGLIATEAAFGTVTEDGGALSGSELDYTNIEARRAMREDDPTLFASLIEAGAFDPAPSELVIALQTELSRMNCYTAGIDGSWGGGSAGALQRYYQQIDEDAPSLEPTQVAFRQILVRDDVECPAVVQAAAPTRAAPTTAAPRRATPTPAAPRRATPAPAAPAPAPSRTINRSTATGVFR